ncbi:MAG: DJ-1/PfpI family protein [Actinomycetota bacterium]
MSRKIMCFFAFVAIAFLVLAAASCGGGEGGEGAPEGKDGSTIQTTEGGTQEGQHEPSATVLLVVAQAGFQDIEYDAVRGGLLDAGYRVVTASPRGGRATGMSGVTVNVDLPLAQARAEEFAAVVFIGGEGAPSLYDDAEAHRVAREAVEQGKVLGAICLAPAILARAGLLEGKRATVYPSAKQELLDGGASYTGAGVEIDGRLITGDGPEASEQFARAIIEALR